MTNSSSSFRWFGNNDPISLEQIANLCNVKHIVTALYHIKIGEIWPKDQIKKLNNQIKSLKMKWSVIESVAIHECIKYGDINQRDIYIKNFIKTMKHLSQVLYNWQEESQMPKISSNNEIILCYNFMPIIDWCRTNIKYKLNSHKYSLKFDYIDYIIFDIYLLKRENAKDDYDEHMLQQVSKRY